MNKQNKILLGLLAFVVACTIGYALFSETITINGTATAKGDFNMSVTCEKGASNELLSAAGITNHEGGYNSDSCSVVGDVVTINTNLEYVGATRYYTIKMTNTGSIPSTYDFENGISASGKICIDGGPNQQIDQTNGQIEDADECYNLGTDSIAGYANLYTAAPVAIETTNGALITGENGIDDYVITDANDNELIKLETGESLYYIVVASMWNYNDDAHDFLVTANVKYDFLWKQITE